MFPKSRIDALTDGIFAVAMTLLVLDIRLPDDFHPRDLGELIHALLQLSDRFVPYIISFGVLGLRWLWNVEMARNVEAVDMRWARWWLGYLLLITCVPFSTILVGRYPALPPAVWVYAVNTALIGLIGMRLIALAPEAGEHPSLAMRLSPVLLVAAAALAILLSFFFQVHALWSFAIVVVSPHVARGVAHRRSDRAG